MFPDHLEKLARNRNDALDKIVPAAKSLLNQSALAASFEESVLDTSGLWCSMAYTGRLVMATSARVNRLALR
jgi:hypothetical protein